MIGGLELRNRCMWRFAFCKALRHRLAVGMRMVALYTHFAWRHLIEEIGSLLFPVDSIFLNIRIQLRVADVEVHSSFWCSYLFHG